MTEYNLRIRHSSSSGGNAGDPFKHALYRLIGRIDVRKNVPVARTTEDWVWFQLSFVREDEVEETATPIGERHGLREMAKLVSKFGEKHFDPRGDRPVFWFQVQLFVGEFEKVRRLTTSKNPFFAARYLTTSSSSGYCFPALQATTPSRRRSLCHRADLLRPPPRAIACPVVRRRAAYVLSLLCIGP